MRFVSLSAASCNARPAMSNRWLLLVFLSMGLLGAISGCRQAALPQDSSKLPVFAVSVPVQREVTDYVEYTGRTGAVQAEEIKARVTGFLVDTPFKEGAEIKKDDVLFKIDPRPYKAQYDQAEAQVGLYESQLKLAKANYERDIELFKRTKGAGVSKQALDADVAQQEQAEAAVKAAKASLEVYKLNLDFCTVKSPIDGQVGRSNQPRGNLIMQDSTLLTTVQSVDPMYVYFDMDMPSYRKFQGGTNQEPGAKIAVSMALQGEEGYPRPGTVDFFNNLVNPATDTLLVRSVFANPKKAIGRELKPGMFVRVKLPISQPHQALPRDRSGHHLHPGPEEPVRARRQGHGPGAARDHWPTSERRLAGGPGKRARRQDAGGGEQAAASPSENPDSTGAATDAHLFGRGAGTRSQPPAVKDKGKG